MSFTPFCFQAIQMTQSVSGYKVSSVAYDKGALTSCYAGKR